MNLELADGCPKLEMTVAELLEQWPACAPVLIERGMACVGCELSMFETLADAARVYGIDAHEFLAALQTRAG